MKLLLSIPGISSASEERSGNGRRFADTSLGLLVFIKDLREDGTLPCPSKRERQEPVALAVFQHRTRIHL
ncbi:UNVERIFIED_CONTAM: hypothetical protein FKN15_069894 [Acipenser sinensis]